MVLAVFAVGAFGFAASVVDFLRPRGFGAGFDAGFFASAASPLSDLLFVRLMGLFSTSSSSSGTGESGRLPFMLATFEAGAFPFAFEVGAFPFALEAGAFDAGFEAGALDAGLDAGALDVGFEAATFASTSLSPTVDSGFPREDLRVRPAMEVGFREQWFPQIMGRRKPVVECSEGLSRPPVA